VQRAGIRRGFPSRPGGTTDPPPPSRLRPGSRNRPSLAPHTVSIRPVASGGLSPAAGDFIPGRTLWHGAAKPGLRKVARNLSPDVARSLAT